MSHSTSHPMSNYSRLVESSPSSIKTVRWEEEVIVYKKINTWDNDSFDNRVDGSLIWYSQDDFQKFRDEILLTVKLSRQGKLEESNATNNNNELLRACVCERGLEHMISKQRGGIRKQRIQRAWNICQPALVHEERDSDDCSRIYEEESITKMYTELSTQCRLEARLQGIRDRVEANKCYASWDDDEKRFNINTTPATREKRTRGSKVKSAVTRFIRLGNNRP